MLRSADDLSLEIEIVEELPKDNFKVEVGFGVIEDDEEDEDKDDVGDEDHDDGDDEVKCV